LAAGTRYDDGVLQSQELNRIVFETAAAHMAPGQLRRVIIEPFVNSGDEIGLRITAVLSDSDPSPVSGDTALDVLLAVSDRLSEAGETRQPAWSFATEEELAHSGDPDT
jgi:hypothetical protein